MASFWSDTCSVNSNTCHSLPLFQLQKIDSDKLTHKPVNVKYEQRYEPVNVTKQQHEIFHRCQKLSLTNVMVMLIVMYIHTSQHGQFTVWRLFMSHVMRKPVLAIYEQQRCRPACASFVIRYLDSIIPILAKSKISRLQLISIAEQTSLSLTWSETQKTGFLLMWLI